MKFTPKSEFKIGDRIAVYNGITKKESFKATIIAISGEGDDIVGAILQDGNEKPHSNGLGTAVKLPTITLGKWELEFSFNNGYRVFSNGINIADIKRLENKSDRQEETANAKLITSAPELLEALELLLLKTYGYSSQEERDFAYEKARMVIAKVTI